MSFDRVKQLVINVFARFRDSGYFQEAFGCRCVDADDVQGKLGSHPNAYFLQAIGRDDMWPYDAEVVPDVPFPSDAGRDYCWQFWDEESLFDMIEALHDLVSKPISGHYHDFSNCGWHYGRFDATAGQQDFREEITHVLRMGGPACEMNAHGEVVEATPDEFRNLVAAPVPEGTEHDLVKQKMDDAIRTFLARGATNVDRQRAVRDLADVLEHLRADMKAVMLSEDENALFNIANNFAIRHNIVVSAATTTARLAVVPTQLRENRLALLEPSWPLARGHRLTFHLAMPAVRSDGIPLAGPAWPKFH